MKSDKHLCNSGESYPGRPILAVHKTFIADENCCIYKIVQYPSIIFFMA